MRGRSSACLSWTLPPPHKPTRTSHFPFSFSLGLCSFCFLCFLPLILLCSIEFIVLFPIRFSTSLLKRQPSVFSFFLLTLSALISFPPFHQYTLPTTTHQRTDVRSVEPSPVAFYLSFFLFLSCLLYIVLVLSRILNPSFLAMFTTNCQNLIGLVIDHGTLQFVSVLGVGAYGVVYLARNLASAQPPYYAVKCLNNRNLDERQKKFQRRELTLHTLASAHPSVVTLHRVIETRDVVYVVMDYVDHGDLFGMITVRCRYQGRTDLITKVFLQILDAVAHCHSLGIYHRDLKPDNILCGSYGEKVCLADFGLATTDVRSVDFGCGSTFYMSPECQAQSVNSLPFYFPKQNDVWSLGIILVNLTCARNPWRQACLLTDETYRMFVHNPDTLRSILPISLETNEILKRIFVQDPTQRIGLPELRELVLSVREWTVPFDSMDLVGPTDEKDVTADNILFEPSPSSSLGASPIPIPTVEPVEITKPSKAHRRLKYVSSDDDSSIWTNTTEEEADAEEEEEEEEKEEDSTPFDLPSFSPELSDGIGRLENKYSKTAFESEYRSPLATMVSAPLSHHSQQSFQSSIFSDTDQTNFDMDYSDVSDAESSFPATPDSQTLGLANGWNGSGFFSSCKQQSSIQNDQLGLGLNGP